ncbi:MAG: LD-carboxypeptidase [Fimbriimonadaceae bacterium]|nr:LD-carboxypeptidase [Fimbriimonadaceae bacterium]
MAQDDLEPGIVWLEAQGYRAKLFPHVFDADRHLAGRDQDRADDLRMAFLDPVVDAVWCSRGGYGASRLLPFLDFEELAATGKPFIGYSDITVLHLALNREGLATLHGPVGVTFARERAPWVAQSFLRNVHGDPQPPVEAPGGQTLVGGRAEGVVTGGCVRLLCDAIGTLQAPDFRDAIVLLEDIGEPPHRVDGMLTQLLNTGLLAKAKGIVVGEFTDTDSPDDPTRPRWRDTVADRLTPLGVPTMVGYPFGHQHDVLTLTLGLRATLDADAGTLAYEVPA